MHPKLPKFKNPDGGKDIDFRRLLLNKCQEEFEKGCKVRGCAAHSILCRVACAVYLCAVSRLPSASPVFHGPAFFACPPSSIWLLLLLASYLIPLPTTLTPLTGSLTPPTGHSLTHSHVVLACSGHG